MDRNSSSSRRSSNSCARKQVSVVSAVVRRYRSISFLEICPSQALDLTRRATPKLLRPQDLEPICLVPVAAAPSLGNLSVS